MLVELLYLEGCPHYAAFAKRLDQLVAQHNPEVMVRHVPIADVEDARRKRFLGSPTLRVDALDVESSARDRTDFGMACRLYHFNGETTGWPPDELVVSALACAARELPVGT